MPPVPFHRSHRAGDELTYLARALEQGHSRGDGPFTEAAAEELRQRTGARAVLLTPSCTAALELSALLLDLGPGDEVIMPSFTFVSTANAFVLRGARPVFVDIDARTLNIDPACVESAITDRTRAIVAVHYAGVACDMTRLAALASHNGIVLIEDNAHGLGGTWLDRPLGSLGALGTLSFHETKNFSCGEGGALLVNDPDLAQRAEVLREKGTNRRAFLQGQVEHYSWVDIGSSYLLGDLLAAALYAQLLAFDEIQRMRHHVWARYRDELSTWASSAGVVLPDPPQRSLHAAHLFHLLLPDPETRSRFLSHMRQHGVGSSFHYVPLHGTDLAASLGHSGTLEVTESAAARLARLPLYPDLSDGEVDRVVEVVTAFRP